MAIESCVNVTGTRVLVPLVLSAVGSDILQVAFALAELNNRDTAVLFWLAVLIVFMLSKPDLRRSLGHVAGALASWALLVPLGLFAAYTAALVYAGSSIEVWDAGLGKDTVLWFLGVGLGLLFRMERVSQRPAWFRTEALRAVRITVLVEFFVNLAVLPLPVELLLVPLLATLGMLSALADADRTVSATKGLVEGCLATLGATLIAFVTIHVMVDWQSFDNEETLRRLALPVWLTPGVLPFVYAVGLYSGFQQASMRVNLATPNRRDRVKAKLALVGILGVRARDVAEFRPYDANQVCESESFRDARQAVREFRARVEEERRFILEQEKSLERFAGVQGTDSHGRQLDRREFAETMEALQYLAIAQSNWYADPDQRYRKDLLESLEPFQGLPEDHGITLHVAPDGQSWWAWRRTVTGWCFAIGAAEPPPDEWLYDGREPPAGPPSDDPGWGAQWELEATNWSEYWNDDSAVMLEGPVTAPSP